MRHGHCGCRAGWDGLGRMTAAVLSLVHVRGRVVLVRLSEPQWWFRPLRVNCVVLGDP